jgi:hypothetical protein
MLFLKASSICFEVGAYCFCILFPFLSSFLFHSLSLYLEHEEEVHVTNEDSHQLHDAASCEVNISLLSVFRIRIR